MANEALITTGSYATVQAATSTADGALCGGSVTAIGTAIASEDLYPYLDFKVSMSVGSPVAGGYVEIYRRSSDGTDQAAAPVYADHKHDYVGAVIFDDSAASSYKYLYGVLNGDPGDTYYMISELGATCTIELEARGRTFGTA